jgi:hypothetical protein
VTARSAGGIVPVLCARPRPIPSWSPRPHTVRRRWPTRCGRRLYRGCDAGGPPSGSAGWNQNTTDNCDCVRARSACSGFCSQGAEVGWGPEQAIQLIIVRAGEPTFTVKFKDSALIPAAELRLPVPFAWRVSRQARRNAVGSTCSGGRRRAGCRCEAALSQVWRLFELAVLAAAPIDPEMGGFTILRRLTGDAFLHAGYCLAASFGNFCVAFFAMRFAFARGHFRPGAQDRVFHRVVDLILHRAVRCPSVRHSLTILRCHEAMEMGVGTAGAKR